MKQENSVSKNAGQAFERRRIVRHVGEYLLIILIANLRSCASRKLHQPLMVKSTRKTETRDARLLSLLPKKTTLYDCQKFSEQELQALIEALQDGFGDVGVANCDVLPLPSTIKSGLLQHPFYLSQVHEFPNESLFWRSTDDGLAPADLFPLGFIRRRLRIYFENQFERFCVYMAQKLQMRRTKDDQSFFEHCASEGLYQKPWYENNALRFLDWIDNAMLEEKRAQLDKILISSFSGQLGRLVEQYLWRFQFERAAITGIGARTGASAGGKARAALHKNERAKWQRMASEIQSRKPRLTKFAIARLVKISLGSPQTAEHIARYIRVSD